MPQVEPVQTGRECRPDPAEPAVLDRPEHIEATRGILGGVLLGAGLWMLLAAIAAVVLRLAAGWSPFD